MQMFHLAVLNALSMLINTQNPLRLPVALLALVAVSTTALVVTQGYYLEDTPVAYP